MAKHKWTPRAALAIAAGAVLYSATANAELTQIALRFDPAPGPGAGNYFSFVTGAINSNGLVVFDSSLTGGTSDEGIFRGDGSGVTSIFRTLQAAPGAGGGQFSDLGTAAINAAGQVAIFSALAATSDASTNGIFRGSDGSTFTAIARDKLAAPSGGSYASLGEPQINSSGQVAFYSTLSGTADGSTTGFFRSDGISPVLLVRDKQAAPGAGAGTFSTLSSAVAVFNDLGQIAFSASVTGGTNNAGVFRAGGATIAIARASQAAPGGGTFIQFFNPDINSRGDVGFLATTATDVGVYRGDGNTTVSIAKTAQSAPGGGTFSAMGIDPVINSSGQAAFYATLANSPDGASSGIFRGDGNVLEAIAREKQAAPSPGGSGAANGVFSALSHPLINSAGTVAFSASMSGTSGGFSDDTGIFLGDAQETIVVAREGQSAFGSTITVVSFAGLNRSSRSPFNDNGQLALNLNLANGNALVARFTPEIHFRNGGGGSWDTAGNWTVGIKPASVHDTFVDPASPFGATVNGPASNVTVKSLTVSGRNGGTAQLNLNGPGNLTVTNAINIAANGSISVQTGSLSGQSLTINGSLSASAGTRFNLEVLTNNGFINSLGDMVLSGAMGNYSTMSLGNGAQLVSTGLNNFGQLTIDNAVIAGPLANSFGASLSGRGTIGGPFTNAGTVTVNGLMDTFASTSNLGVIDVGLADNLRIWSGFQNSGLITMSGGGLTSTGVNPLVNNPGGIVQGGGAISITLNNAGLINANSTQPLLINSLGNGAAGQIRVADGSAINVVTALGNTGLINLGGGSASISAPNITNGGTIRGSGMVASPVFNSGTIRAEGGLLALMGVGSTNTSLGQIQVNEGATVLYGPGLATNAGTLTLTGGTFDNNNQPLNNTNTGRITGWGTFSAFSTINNGSITFTGGFTTINGSLTNSAGKQIRVAYNPALFTGNVTNNGVFKSTSTTVTFAGTYTENGTFISDPADNFFNDLIVGADGALVGGVGDRFFINGNLISSSLAKTGWDTRGAELHFVGDTFHHLSVGGTDLGKTFDGYIDNFAWGDLFLDANQHIVLEDADGDGKGALYVGGFHAFSTSAIGKITGNGLDIYYDINNPANAYLGGRTYAMAGGGSVMPVPEPTSILFASLTALLALGRRRRGYVRS